MKRGVREWVIFVSVFIILIMAIGISRGLKIQKRPMHCDEANQAYKTGILLEKGVYKYDPFEHHGPLLYYSTLPIFWISKVNKFSETEEWMYRIVPLLFSLLIFLLLLPMKDYYGYFGFFCSFLYLSVSHIFFFYSRYYIHEMAFVFFSGLFSMLLWEYLISPSLIRAMLCGVGASLAFATKETSIITIPSSMISCGVLCFFSKRGFTNKIEFLDLFRKRYVYHTLGFTSGFLIVWVAFFSSFFTNWSGLLEFFKAYQFYLFRASGQGSSGIHDKPWWYYLQILTYFNKTVGPTWSELHILIPGVIGIILILIKDILLFTGKVSKLDLKYIFATHLLISFGIPFIVFCTIPYKTPWNMLYPMLGFIFFAGVGLNEIFKLRKSIFLKVVVLGYLVISILHLSYLTYQGNFIYYADVSNPYVYAHTSTSLVKMMERVYELSEIIKSHNEEPIVVVIDPQHDYWPIPWYLRKINKRGFYADVPKGIDKIKLLIVSPKIQKEVEEKLGGESYMVFTYSIRPSALRYLYVEKNLWEEFMKNRT